MRSTIDYGDYGREEVLPYLPEGARRVLDVGCGKGGFGKQLKLRQGVEWVTGIEPDSASAAVASSRLDEVICSTFPCSLGDRHFDLVVFNDVLEHMADPAAALEFARSVMSSSAHVVVSLPNVRHIDVVRDLVLRGQWTYGGEGVLDWSHLRFFTRKSGQLLLVEAGFEIVLTVGINAMCRNPYLNALLRGARDRHFLPLQFLHVARLVGGDNES